MLNTLLSPFKNSLSRVLPLCVLLLLTALPAHTREISFSINGIEGPLKDNVLLYLKSVPAPSGDSIGGYKKQLRLKAAEGLKPLGYYQPQINLDSKREKEQLKIELDIVQGPRVTLNDIDIQLSGEAQQDPKFIDYLANQPLKPGMPLLHSEYETLKGELISLALERGYFDSQWQHHAIKISQQHNSASLVLHLDTGIRYHFGSINVIEPEQPGQSDTQPLVLSMATFTPGDPFEANKLAEYNLALSSSQYFSRIQILPRQKEHVKKGDPNNGHRLPIDVTIIKKPENSVELGGGVSTDVGIRGKIKWEKPWLNSYGHSISAEMDLSAKKQTVSTTYKIPIEDPINNYASVVAGWQRLNIEDTDSRKLTLQLQRHWLLDSEWQRTAFIKFEREDYRQGRGPKEVKDLVIPGVSYGRTRSRGGLNVHWGDRQLITMELSHNSWASDADLTKLHFQTRWLRTFDDTHRLVFKADLGAMVIDSILDAPPTMRFFTGGDDNLRGFALGTVSPVDENGDDTGGKYLATSSLDYSYPILDKWRLATFVDVGTATNDFSEEWNADIGFGVRWQTPVGPLRVDLAFPVAHEKDDVDQVRLSFSIGPEL